ncbi:MAG: proton-dependent oligopeptide transporter, family [Acidobacteriota bacterium]|jgi:POT family proton-dependent oligopeptide transporter|nr:proton-dependent oligopeptide transporter, family [Acidobacteriota bacterium]
MSEAIDQPTQEVVEGVQDAGGLGGHPRGLTTLFFTEMWERFSYYGMRAILVLYMVALPEQGGLGFDTKRAASIYGTYTMSVYLTALPGGLIADRWLGARLAVLLGGIVIACGHFTMIFQSTNFLYAGMALIAIGTGLLKPNISAMVGGLYRENDPRRDSGFSLFYMGINVGAVLAPLVCGYLAQSEGFRGFLAANGFNPATSWHWGFGAAGVGMTLGLVVFLLQRGRLRQAESRIEKRASDAADAGDQSLTSGDWKRIGAIFIFFLFTMLFWAAYEQKGASLNLFAAKLVNTEVFGYAFPSSWLQSLTPFYVIILAPLFSILWVRMGDRQPSSPAKFTFGLLFIGLAYLLFMTPAAWLTAGGKVSPLWLVGLYFLEVVGEMCLSPVGLSTVTKLAPLKLVGIMMGVWFLASSLGSKLAGYLSGFFDAANPSTLVRLYGGIAVGLLVATGILAALIPTLRRLMGRVR